jgi:serine O-acetyltransferase
METPGLFCPHIDRYVGEGRIGVKDRNHEKAYLEACKVGHETRGHYREQIPAIVEGIVDSCQDKGCFEHIHAELIPSRKEAIGIVTQLRELLFPGYFNQATVDATNLRYQVGKSVDALSKTLSEQITRSLRHECRRYDQPCVQCVELGYKEALTFLEAIPGMRRVLATDVRAAFDGDPAAKSYDEIVFSYPGVFAVMVYRIAHQLLLQDVPLLPRIMTEYAHSVTGIDIHPGATIGQSFFIDHGTGVVIGETTNIGKHVRIYQGVTLGALSIPKDGRDSLKDKKRHPSIEDHVIIYAGATILGGETVIGARSVIGGNVWLTQSVPPDTKVFLETPKLVFRQSAD